MTRADGSKSRSGPSGTITDDQRKRPALKLTLSPATIAELTKIAKRAQCSRGRVVDSLVAAAVRARRDRRKAIGAAGVEPDDARGERRGGDDSELGHADTEPPPAPAPWWRR